MVVGRAVARAHHIPRDCKATWSIRTIPRYAQPGNISAQVGWSVLIVTIEGTERVSIDEQHVAMPKLYGAPAYGRPPRHAGPDGDRPFDPDELPIEADRTDEEQEFVSTLPAQAYAPGGILLSGNPGENTTETNLRPRSFSLRSVAGKLFGGD